MLHIAEAKQIGRGDLSYYAKFPWKDFSQKLGELGYLQVNQVPIPRGGSLHVLSRHDYSPPSFLPRDEPVRVSSAAMVQVHGEDEKVGHILMTRPGINLSADELAHDANVIGKYFIDKTKLSEVRLSPNGWGVLATLGIYASSGLAAGVGVGELLYQHTPTVSTESRYGMDVAFGLSFLIGFPMARMLFENKVRHPLLRMRAASQMNVSSYLFGSDAVNSIDSESRAQQFETAASLVHAELKSSGVAVDEERFYKAFAIIQNLGVDNAEKIVPVTRVPLERIVELVRTHPGILPTPASAR